MKKNKNRLRTGHPDKGRDSHYKAYIVANGAVQPTDYSLPEYDKAGKGIQKLKEHVTKKYPTASYVAIYDLAAGSNADPLLVLNTEKGNQWQPFDDYQNSKPKTQNSKLETRNSSLKTHHSKPHYRAAVIQNDGTKDGLKTFVPSDPQADNQLETLKAEVLAGFNNIRYIGIYDSRLAFDSKPVTCFNKDIGTWQTYPDFVTTLRPLYSKPKTQNPTPSNYVMWIPLKEEHRKTTATGHKLYSVDVDTDTGEVGDHISAQSLEMQFQVGNWIAKANGAPRVYRNGTTKPIAYYSIAHGKIFYHQTTREFGKPQHTEGVKKINKVIA
jgi:hypothetical protein